MRCSIFIYVRLNPRAAFARLINTFADCLIGLGLQQPHCAVGWRTFSATVIDIAFVQEIEFVLCSFVQVFVTALEPVLAIEVAVLHVCSDEA